MKLPSYNTRVKLPAASKDIMYDGEFQLMLLHVIMSVTVALWYRLPLGTEQVVSLIPGSVGYISHVH